MQSKNDFPTCLGLKCLRLLFPLSILGGNLLFGAEYGHHVDHRWNIVADAVFMRRTAIHDRPLVINSDKDRECPDDCDDFSVIRSKGLVKHFHFDPGFRVGLIYSEDIKNSFEALFLWVRPWHAHQRAVGGQTLSFPFTKTDYAFDYFQASEATAEYHSRFWDVELNYWRHFSPRYADFFSISGIAGMRYFHLNESFKLTFIKPPDKSDYSTHTENDIFGAQIGLNLQMAPTYRLSWDFTGKAGVMVNRAKQRNLLLDYNNTVTLRRFDRQKWQRGLFGDILAQAGYQFKEPLNLHAGYEFIVISGVALAPEQVESSTSSAAGKKVETGGFVFIHGFFVGATLSF